MPIDSELRSKLEGIEGIEFARAIRRSGSKFDVAVYFKDQTDDGPDFEGRLECRQAIRAELADHDRVDQVVVINEASPRLAHRALFGIPILCKNWRSLGSFVFGTLKDQESIVGRLIRFFLMTLFLVGTGAALAYGLGGDSATKRSPGLLASARLEAQQVTVEGSLEPSRLAPTKPLIVRLTIKNVGSTKVQGLRISKLEIPGFDKIGTCWWAGKPVCAATRLVAPFARQPSRDLDPNASVTFWGELAQSQGERISRLAAVVAWRDSQGSDQSLDIPFEPIKPKSRIQAGFKSLYGFAKDFALPIAVVCLGFFFERVRQRQELGNEMLQKIHQNAQEHYMPMSSSVFVFLSNFRKWKAKGAPGNARGERENLMLFNLLKLFVKIQVLNRKIGGYYFKQRGGEHAVAETWKMFRQRLLREEGEIALVDFHTLLSSISDPHESYDRFMKGAAASGGPNRGAFQRVREGFVDWLDQQATEDSNLLKILEQLLDYEMNVPYESWYGRKEVLAVGPCRTWLWALSQQSQAEKPAVFERYLERTQNYLFSREDRPALLDPLLWALGLPVRFSRRLLPT